MFFVIKNTEPSANSAIDKYGDSFARDVTAVELKDVMKIAGL